MKNLFYTFIALFMSIASFAQSSQAKTQSIEKLLDARNGSTIFTRILDSNIDQVAPDKQAEFKQKINAEAAAIRADAIQYFSKKYSQQDIDAIYAEFTTEGRIDFSQKTLSFIREWRNFKGKFQQRFKEIYQSL